MYRKPGQGPKQQIALSNMMKSSITSQKEATDGRKALEELKKKMQLSKKMAQQNKQQQAMYPMNDQYTNTSGYGGGNTKYSGKSGRSNIYSQVRHGEVVEDLPRSPCPVCGRMFVMESLVKHSRVCKNVSKKRRVFDSKNKRLIDGEQAALQVYGENDRKRLEAKKKMQKNYEPKWKKESEEFRRVLRENRILDAEKRRGQMCKYTKYKTNVGRIGGMSKHFKPSVINDAFTLCRFCNRKYNDETYKKHAPGCEKRFNDSIARNKILKGVGSKPNPRAGKR